MIYTVKKTSQFEKDYKLAIKRNKKMQKLHEVVDMLQKGKKLPQRYHDHPLSGNWKTHRECHIEGDWLLIYQIKKDVIVLELTRTGTHADLFGK